MTGAGQGTAVAGGQIIGAIQAVGSIAGSYIQYEAAKEQLASQLRMAIAQYAHQDKMAEMGTGDALDKLSADTQKQEIVKEGLKVYNTAVEDRKRAEDGLKAATALLKESKRTKAAGSANRRALDRIFHRTQYSYGKPLRA